MYPKAHTHGAYDPTYCSDVFSDKYNEYGEHVGDIGTADKIGVPLYLATPSGVLRRYDPRDRSDVVISNDIPWDPNHPDR